MNKEIVVPLGPTAGTTAALDDALARTAADMISRYDEVRMMMDEPGLSPEQLAHYAFRAGDLFRDWAAITSIRYQMDPEAVSDDELREFIKAARLSIVVLPAWMMERAGLTLSGRDPGEIIQG